MSAGRYIGRSVPRLEDRRFITGTGRYVGDMRPDDLLHAQFVRSPIAHGTLLDVDVADARSAPGVVAVFAADDLNLGDFESTRPAVPMPRPMLARDRVRYVGEAVAVVIAETEAAATDAAELIWPDIEELDVISTLDQARADGQLLHSTSTSNIVSVVETGPVDEPWDYPVDITVDVTNQRVSAAPIEPLAGLAEPFGHGVRLWATHQTPHRFKKELETVLDFPVDVTVPDVGGGFGLKGRFYPELAVICAAARRLGRPVRWIQSRRESLSGGTHGRAMTHRVRLGGDADGNIRRCHIEFAGAAGAYPHTATQVLGFATIVAQQLYDLEVLSTRATSYLTNHAPIAPYRGAGRPEAAYAVERAVEAFARAVGKDPIEVRRMNLLRPTSFPHQTLTGALYDSGDYGATFELALEALDVEAVRAEQARRRAAGENPIGLGLGVFVERAGGPPTSGEYAKTEITPNGDVLVYTGSTSNGQGHETVWSQVAAQVFDVPLDRVEVIGGDTVRVEQGWGSTASRSAQIGASGVLRTAEKVLERAKQLAADRLEAAVEDLVINDGHIMVAGSASAGVPLAELARLAAESDDTLTESEFYSPGFQTFPFGVYAAIVEVSIETGDVSLLDLIAVDDCGNVLNPMIVDGQVHGSIAQGIGQALMEAILYDDRGQLLSSTFMDYPMPRAADMPKFRLERTVSPAPSNPLGVKGSGESGCIGSPPAIVNAVLDALQPWGVTHLDMPLRPMTVWKAIQNATR